MPPASRWTLQLVVTLDGHHGERELLALRLHCWLERVARLIARRDTPREAGAADGAADAPPAR